MFDKPKLIRTSTVAISLDYLLKGQLSFLNNVYNVLAVSGKDRYLETIAQREMVDTVSVNMQREISPLKDFKSLWLLYLLFRKEKPLIVHSITPKAGLLSMMAAKMAGVPIRMHTFTGLIFPSRSGIMRKLLIKMDQLLCVCATHVYPEGEGVKNDLLSYGITRKPLKVLANGNVNGIDTEFFSIEEISLFEQVSLKKELGIKPDDFVFVFVGRLVRDKGINELIAAFEILLKENSQVKLLLVGSFEPDLDPLLPKTLEIIERNTNIISVGFQSSVRTYFAISDALVFPSYREGFPNVVIQAGAMGLPSIVSDINGCNEIIVEGVNGTIIQSKNVPELINAMKKLMFDNEYYNQLQQNARPMIKERYEQSVVWDALCQEYNFLVASL